MVTVNNTDHFQHGTIPLYVKQGQFFLNLVEAQFTLSFQLFASPYACLVNKPASLCTCYCSWQVLYYWDNSFFTTLSAACYYALFLSFG